MPDVWSGPLSNPTPDFRFAAFYYPEILAALLAFKEVDWPEHTETDPHDPVIQELRIGALIGHGSAVRLDHTARELYLPSLQLRSSIAALGALVDYQLAPASPAVVDLVASVNRPAAGDVLLRALSRASTSAREAVALVFEYLETTDWAATDGVGVYPLVVVGDDGAGTYEAVDLSTTLSWLFSSSGDADGSRWVAFGNTDLEFDRIGITVAGGSDLTTRWEYREDLRELAPDLATDNLDGTITFDVTTLVGNDHAPSTGLLVTVRCLRTGIDEVCATVNAGGAGGTETITTTTTLGQTTISENQADYLVTAEWIELPDVTDGTDTAASGSSLEGPGTVAWTIPEATDRRWARTGIAINTGAEAGSTLTGHFVRVRVVAGTDFPTTADFDEPTEPIAALWGIRWEATQGQRVVEVLGESTGEAGQTFTLSSTPFLSLLSLTIDALEWTRADNFLVAGPFDRVFTLLEQPDGSWEVRLGDGARGKIPTPGDRIQATYRIGGAANGNVGPKAITRDRTGNNRIRDLRNPRSADGWAVAEATTEAGLDLARQAIPASQRTRSRVVTPGDAEDLAVAYRTTLGGQLAVRALAVEEGAGPKTLSLFLVGPGGVAPTPAEIAEVAAYFNGQSIGIQRVGGVRLGNTSIECQAYTPRVIDVTYTADVLEPYADAAKAKIAAALQAALQPNAFALVLNAAGAWVVSDQFQWGWGSTVALAILTTRIATATPGIVNLAISLPATDVALGDGELPVPGTIAGTITSVPV